MYKVVVAYKAVLVITHGFFQLLSNNRMSGRISKGPGKLKKLLNYPSNQSNTATKLSLYHVIIVIFENLHVPLYYGVSRFQIIN